METVAALFVITLATAAAATLSPVAVPLGVAAFFFWLNRD